MIETDAKEKEEMIEILTTRFVNLQKQIKKNEKDHQTLVKCLHTIESMLVERVWNIKEGSLVKFTVTGEIMRVVEVELHVFRDPFKEKPWVRANPKKNDGSFSKSERNIYESWEVMEDEN